MEDSFKTPLPEPFFERPIPRLIQPETEQGRDILRETIDTASTHRCLDVPGFEEIRMIADFPQLHQNVEHAAVVADIEGLLYLTRMYEFIVQTSLSLREDTADDVLVFARHLLLHILLQTAQ